MLTKNNLAIQLSKLKGFTNPKIKLEQYSLDSETASLISWAAFLNNDIENKVLADLGAGTGILAKGCLLLKAKKVYCVEKDPAALSILKENIKEKNAILINKDIKDFNNKVDVVIQNPPCGTKNKHADKDFLEKAMQLAGKIYSLHKITSRGFIAALAKDNHFVVEHVIPITTHLKATYSFHKKPKKAIALGLWVLKRKV